MQKTPFWLFEAALEGGGSIALEPGHPPIRVTQMGWPIIPLVLEHLPQLFDDLMPYRSAATTVDNCNASFFTRNLAPNSIALVPANGEAENMRILLGG